MGKPKLNDAPNTTGDSNGLSSSSSHAEKHDGSVASSSTAKQMLKVTFQVAEAESVGFSVPVSCLEEREAEMKRTANKLNVPSDKWHSSRLYEEFLESQRPSELELVLHKPWINQRTLEWISKYYTTGTLQIPSDAHGYDVLAALEYFSILYSPDQCIFASYDVYQRVQQWARYLSVRDQLTEYVVSHLNRTPLYFSTTPVADARMELGTETGLPLGGSSSELCKSAHKLFNSQDPQALASIPDDSTLPSPQETTAFELRKDFCAHLERTAVVSEAQFAIQPVTVHTQSMLRVVQRSVLRVEPAIVQKKKKLVFLLPHELESSSRPVSVIKASEDNTVTSGLTGPFYTDPTGQKRDVYADDDTFAQAKRHEWVQTALMNRGINERMEELLHPKHQDDRDPWEWLTGLGVCEMSRTVMESMEQYYSKVRRTTPEAQAVAEAGAAEGLPTDAAAAAAVLPTEDTAPPPPLGESGVVVKRKPSRVKDRLRQVQAMTSAPASLDDSKESPRGVDEVFDEPVITSIKPIVKELACAPFTSDDTGVVLEDDRPVVPRRRGGILKMFRRRKGF